MNDSELFGGFDFTWTDEQTDICTSRVAFATEKIWNEEIIFFQLT